MPRHSLANWDCCPTPAKSEAIEYLQVGPTEIRLFYSLDDICLSIAWSVSVNRNIVRYNKYLVVVTVVVVLSAIVIVIVISLEHSTVVVRVFKFKFEYPIYSIFRQKEIHVSLKPPKGWLKNSTSQFCESK